jgi:uncharacterized protein (DUF983 family)
MALQWETTPPAAISSLSGIVRQLCPRCRRGKMFDYSIFCGLPHMREQCPECGLKFAREPGYFLGAMYISYGLAILTIPLLALILWAFTGWPLERVAIRACVIFLPLAVPIALLSRVLWIYIDRFIDPN